MSDASSPHPNALFNIKLNLLVLSTVRSPLRFLPFRFPDSSISHTFESHYTPCLPHPPL